MLVGVRDPKLVSAGKVVKNTAGAKEVVNRSGHIFMDRTVRTQCVNESLRIVNVPVQRQQERGLLAVSYGAGQRSLVELSLLRWFLSGEGVARVEYGIAEQEVDRSMKIRSSALRDDLEARAAGSREQRGVRVLIYFYFLNGGWGYAWAVGFHSIHHQCDTVCADGVVVEEPRESCNVVLVEYRDSVQCAPVHRVGILVFCNVGSYLRRRVLSAYRHDLALRCDEQVDSHGRELFFAHGDVQGRFPEASRLHVDPVNARGQFCKAERARVVRRGVADRGAIDVCQRHWSA